jgi:hypothetical protein
MKDVSFCHAAGNQENAMPPKMGALTSLKHEVKSFFMYTGLA